MGVCEGELRCDVDGLARVSRVRGWLWCWRVYCGSCEPMTAHATGVWGATISAQRPIRVWRPVICKGEGQRSVAPYYDRWGCSLDGGTLLATTRTRL